MLRKKRFYRNDIQTCKKAKKLKFAIEQQEVKTKLSAEYADI